MPRNIPDIDQLTELWEPRLRDAFLESIDGVTDRVTLKQITALLERGDIDGLLDYLRINRLSFQGFEIAMYSLDHGRFTVAAGACGVAALASV